MPLALRVAMILSAAILAYAATKRRTDQQVERQPYFAAARDVAVGERLGAENLRIVELADQYGALAASAVDARTWSQVVGRTLYRPLKRGELLRPEDVVRFASLTEAAAEAQGFVVETKGFEHFVKTFEIGAAVVFDLWASPRERGATPGVSGAESTSVGRSRPCGPWKIVAIDRATRQLDVKTMSELERKTVTLAWVGGRDDADAHRELLLDAIGGGVWRIVGWRPFRDGPGRSPAGQVGVAPAMAALR